MTTMPHHSSNGDSHAGNGCLPEILAKKLNVPWHHETLSPRLRMGGYRTGNQGNIEENALIHTPDIEEQRNQGVVLLRMDSACFTGNIFGDDRCDCKWQLWEAIRMIEAYDGPGLVIHLLAHEGKGHGFTGKLKAFDEITQTFPVNGDLRVFHSAIAILVDLRIKRVRLMTNSPEKCQTLVDHGIEVVEVVPVISQNPAHRGLLQHKATTFGHLIPPDLLKNGDHTAGT